MLDDKETAWLAKFVRYEEPPFNNKHVKELRKFLNIDNLSEVLGKLPSDLASMVEQSIACHPLLKAVGYWRSRAELELPDPSSLVSQRVIPGRENIESYLRSGAVYAQWRGISWCRFRCGLTGLGMGSRCLTDGEWVWPEGLAHYIGKHSVTLPDAMIESMRRRGWKVPVVPRHVKYDVLGKPNQRFWISWAKGT
ncbi:MAG TPA: hypothetical protein VFE47_17745 [Tepidisphaeraceae bacterium]|jgi:hypothetical protein|nr:hypothetical protein [Tepidisphaeraceae bacterium]